MTIRHGRVLTAITLSILIAACGSRAPRPTAELALTDAALQNAVLAGAREHAPIELRRAHEKKAAADRAMADEEYALARRMSDEARVDAELARARAEAEKTRMAVAESEGNIRMMRNEVQRKTSH